jgi:F0F1-type ATP synthase beta subunit
MKNIGKIVQVIGPVVDVSFEQEGASVPNILDALVITKENGQKLFWNVSSTLVKTLSCNCDGFNRRISSRN